MPKEVLLVALAVAVVLGAVQARRGSRRRDPERAYAAGNAAFAEQAFSDAVGHYSRAVGLTPGFVPAFVKRGMARLSASEFDEARADFDRAAALDPRSSEAYFGRGVLHWVQGRSAEAAPDLAKAVELDPDDKLYYDRLSTALYESKRDSEVEGVYRKAYETDHGRDWALWGWLEAIHARDDYPSLQAVCESLSAQGPASAALSYHLGLLAFHDARMEDTRRYVEDALRLDPDQTPTYANAMLATAYKSLGDSEQAARYRRRLEAATGGAP